MNYNFVQAGSDRGGRKNKKSHGDGRSTAKVVGYTMVLTVIISISVYRYGLLPQPNLATSGTKFSVANARKHLNAITSLGIRNAGSVTNDIEARDVILNAVSEIKKSAADEVEIEVSLQNPSGSFYLDFLGGFTNIYENLTNVVVRFSQRKNQPAVKHALLVNCHFDSAIGSPAASDDAVSCAILLEVLRCLSSTPVLLDHAVIFLFNGAEEMVLPASHGFITRHPWAKEVRAFLNLEAAGAGGKELVFQTGPLHPWLSKAYAKSAVYPTASVFGEEVFQSGVIPGDTDFRIFRDFGNIPGIDMAYYINGYVYHTEYDIPELIPDGSIQRAGENILSIVKEIANSPYLADPGEEKHGKVVYFDFIGLFMVIYPMRIGVVLNWSMGLLALIILWKGGRRKRRGEGYLFILKTSAVLLISEAAAVVAGVLTALLTTMSGHTLSYYSRPYLVIPLFYIPGMLAMGAVHYWWRRKHPYLSADYLDYITTLSSHLLWLPLLVLTTYFRLCSSFIPLMNIAFPLLFWSILWHKVLKPISNDSIPLSLLCLSGSLVFIPPGIALAQTLHDLFVPIMGRCGSELPPDVLVGVMSNILLCLLGLNMLPILVHYSKQWLLKLVLSVGTLLWVLCLSGVLLGLVFPYSARDPIAPKRLFFQQTRVTFHHSKDQSYSGILIHPVDTRNIDPITESSPYFRDNLEEKMCEGIYCGLPYYYPVAHMLKRQWYMDSVPPPVKSAHLHLESVVKTSEDTRNFTFVASFPNRGRLYIEPVTGMNLTSWSLDHFIPPLTPYGDDGQGCYFLKYVRGIRDNVGGTEEEQDKHEMYKFWIEIKGDVSVSPSVELAAVALYLDPPLSDTSQLREVKNKLPNWVTSVSLTSTLDSWRF